jgi:hypothetical protein
VGANARSEPIASNKQIGVLTAAISEIDVNATAVLLDALKHIAEMITLTVNRL